jgi:hypothetical protein
MSITLSTIGSRNVTITIAPSPFEEAPGGILIFPTACTTGR